MSIDWMPVRKISPKERGNHGLFPSMKVPQGFVEYESQLERDLFLLFNHAPDVIKFQHQPVKIPYKDEKGKLRKYTPDVYGEFNNGLRVLIEVKYEEFVSSKGKKFETRWKAAEEWAMQRGYIFVILTEKAIRRERWINIWITLGSSKCAENDKYMSDLIALIQPEGDEYNPLCFKLAETLGVEIGKAAQIICYAIYHGLVFMDTFSTSELSKNTIIRPKKRIENIPFRPLWDEFQWSLESNIERTSENISEDSKKTHVAESQIKSLSSKILDKYEDEVEKREEIVKAWLKQPSKKRTPEWRANFEMEWGINERTVYRWVKAYKKNKSDGLIPAHQKAGRPMKYDRATLELMEKARNYFIKPGKTLKHAFDNLETLCKKQNITVPNEFSFRRYIYQNTTAAELARKRGAKFFKSHFTPSLASFQGAIMPMQILQFDNTPFDAFPVDSEYRLALGTPNLTAAIDCYTRMMTGFYLSLSASSSQTILEVLVQSSLPKQNYTEIYDTQHNWPIQGLPVMILADNGMDYRSKALKRFCRKYDIILEYVPIRTPRFKAYIEQWFNVLRKALKGEGVPGYRPLLRERLENPDLKPEKTAVCTMQILETWLYQWIVDDYHYSNSYDDHVNAPFLQWKKVQDGNSRLILPLPRETPEDKREVDLMFLMTLNQDERKLGSDGVVWKYLKYNNKELAEVFSVIGEGRKVTILLDRRDIRYIWVINPINDYPIRVGLASGWASAILDIHGDMPIIASTWLKDVKAIKKRVKRELGPYIYKTEYSRLQRQKLLEEERRETKRIRREKEKVKESSQKSLYQRIQKDTVTIPSAGIRDDTIPDIYEDYTPEGLSSVTKKDDIYDTYIPKGLPTARYPRKKSEMNIENEEKD